MSRLPKELSVGEETLALHLKINGIEAQREVRLIDGRKWQVDFLIPENRLVVEVEGGTRSGKSRHSRGEGFEGDCRKYNALTLAGYFVLRFSTAMVQSGEAINTIMPVLGASRTSDK